MTRALESLTLIIVGLILIFIIPFMLEKRISSITADSYEQKVVDQLAYKIQTEKKVYVSDLYDLDGYIIAYEDYKQEYRTMVSWAEISQELMDNPNEPYIFHEKYVQIITHSGLVTSLRVN